MKNVKFYPEERIGLFIDGSNLYAAARALDFDIDYKIGHNLGYNTDQGPSILGRLPGLGARLATQA